jgi:hexosaminidase
MKTDSLSTTEELHQYFVRRVEGIVDSLGKEMVGWDDIIKDTLINSSVVLAWHGEQKVFDATNRKMPTVITPARYFNFDQYQVNPKDEPLAVGGMLTLEEVYKFNPIPADLPKQNEKYIIGIEANLWTAYMKTPEYVEYMMFPRTAALAELCWSPKADKNYPWFRKRLAEQIKSYEANGIKYCKSEFE